MPSLRVVFLIENASILRDRRVRQESAVLAAAGGEVSVVCPWIRGETRPPATINGARIYYYRQPWQGSGRFSYFLEYGWSLLATFFIVLGIGLRRGFDVLHAATPPDLFFLLAASFHCFGKKFIYDQHDLSPELFTAKFRGRTGLLHRLLLLLERCSYRIADLVIVPNHCYRRLAIVRGQCPPEKICVVRNDPDLRRFRCGPPQPELKRGAAFLALYVGLMSPQDGIDRIIRAAHHVISERGRTDVHFALLGDGPSCHSLRQLARSLGLDRHVSFPGFVADQDLLTYLSTADVCIAPDPPLPLNHLCTMIKIMEYMSCGKPIVSFDLEESRYSAGPAALYVQEDDPAQFGDAILELLDDPARRRRMGQAGLQRVREELNWERSRLALLEAYGRLSGMPLTTARETEEQRERAA